MKWILIILCCFFSASAFSQKVRYVKPLKDSTIAKVDSIEALPDTTWIPLNRAEVLMMSNMLQDKDYGRLTYEAFRKKYFDFVRSQIVKRPKK